MQQPEHDNGKHAIDIGINRKRSVARYRGQCEHKGGMMSEDIGFHFEELMTADGLRKLDRRFFDWLRQRCLADAERLEQYRQGRPGSSSSMSASAVSQLLIDVAVHLQEFIIDFFAIHGEAHALSKTLLAQADIQKFKALIVQKRAKRLRKPISDTFDELTHWLRLQLDCVDDMETGIARKALQWLEDEAVNAAAVEKLVQWCALALHDDRGRRFVAGWQSFHLPATVDQSQLVSLQASPGDGYGRWQSDPHGFRSRDGFHLTDKRMSLAQAENEVHYCIYCHDHDGDFCSKGFPVKKADRSLGIKKNSLDDYLTGCPLEEKISEMHRLRSRGHGIAALAVAMVDNPMIPATGHRICNDCMKSCIYQKQQPVDIPQTETRILTDVLALRWGVEIYDLLARWNPLREQQYVMQAYNGRNVLIAGMGPAGFTMAHHLTMAGCAVVGIDGLKIEPLPEAWLHAPVKSFTDMIDDLDERIMMGFGGVAEYGITVRWDKNFLKLIYLTLARRQHFQVFGGVRFGGTLEVEDAWSLGFDHVCIASGAGYPRVLTVDNGLARGVRQANDFLMALQLTGAAKDSSLASLQVRLPAIVIGSGLTAIDTATEVQAFYIKQVEKLYRRHQAMLADRDEQTILAPLDDENRAILKEYLAHGAAVVELRREAQAAGFQETGQAVDFVPLLRRWGGVTIVYRKDLKDSPAYRRNHEEINLAMREGIFYLPAMEPVRFELDSYGHVSHVILKSTAGDEGERKMPARAVFVAAGANPNTIYEHEHPGHFQLQGVHYQPYDGDMRPVESAAHCKDGRFGPFTSYHRQGRKISFVGDAHPRYHGSVVKAIASAKKAYPHVLQVMKTGRPPPQTASQYWEFRRMIQTALVPRVDAVHAMENLIELWVRAPLAAKKFKPGQFFRLQTYESLSPVVQGTRLQIPLQTISGAGIDAERIRLILLRFGANARLAERLKVDDPIVLMGPNGAPASLPRHKTVLVIAGSWGAAVMLDLGPALRDAGNRVMYVAAYRSSTEISFKQELEAACDQMIWATAVEPLVDTVREHDESILQDNVVNLLRDYGLRAHGQSKIALRDVDEVLVMGSTGLLAALQAAFERELKPLFSDHVQVIGTVGSPMQCMLKGVCAQCLQWQRDPQTGKPTRAVFTCAMQDQVLAEIDLDNLSARQKQNRLSEYLNAQWLNHVLDSSQS